MSGIRGIDLALDLARIPALAQSVEEAPLPTDIFDVMRIAAGSPDACQSASRATGQPVAVLIEAAKFYLQHALLRRDVDPYRVLGLPPGASRELARSHLRCLLQWLHPDVNRDWDSIYTERVLKAWREVSSNICGSDSRSHVAEPGSSAPVNFRPKIKMPWIENPRKNTKMQGRRALMPVAQRVGIGVAGVALLMAVMIAVYASHSG